MSSEQRKKFGHRWYRLISASEVGPGDYIEIYDRGRRWRKVASVTKRYIRTKPYKYNGILVYGSKRISRSIVLTAWTKRKP